jgi:hypothetical protein
MGASRRGGLGRPGARPDRIITFRSDIAFPSAHDHGALCPRQARSAPIGQTLRWLSDRKRTVIRNPIPWQAADAARANTRSFGRAAGVAPPALPRRARAGPAAPGPDPPGPAPLGLPGPRALFRLACPDRGLCSAWPARTAGSAPPGLPRVPPSPGGMGVPAVTCPRRRGLRPTAAPPGQASVPRWDAQTRAGWAGPPQSASAISRDWRRPRPASDSGGAPHELSQVQDLLDPRSSHSPPLPRRINPPEPAGVEANWRTYGVHVENPPPP